jgi:glycosyltransferase involved in cell wall biosynthesis
MIGRDMFHAYPYYKKSLQEKINQENLQHRFTMLDFTDNIRDYMQELDILIHLAQNEPFGRVIIEAMALEKPVIALNSGGPSEIISHGRSGYLVDTPDAAAIAGKLNILVNDAALRKQFGTEGRKIINERFNIVNLEKINDIITTLL